MSSSFDDPLGKNRTITLRLLCRKDEKDVKELSTFIYANKDRQTGKDIFLDYVPHRFLRYLDSSNHFVIGIQVNNKIVGLRIVTILDEQKTAWAQALRIHHDYRGQKLNYILGQSPSEFSLPSSVCRWRWTKAFKAGEKVEDPSKSIRLIHRRSAYLLHMNNALLELIAKHYSQQPNRPNDIQTLDGFETYHALKHVKQLRDLFDNDVIHVDWIGYDITQRNLMLIELGGQTTDEHSFCVGQKSFATVGFQTRGQNTHVFDVSIYTKTFEEFIRQLYWITHIEQQKENRLQVLSGSKIAGKTPYHANLSYMFLWISPIIQKEQAFQQFLNDLNEKHLAWQKDSCMFEESIDRRSKL